MTDLRRSPSPLAESIPVLLSKQITGYLVAGGLFNPEMMEHDKVRDLLMEIREFLDSL